MDESKEDRNIDIICTGVGALILVALAFTWAVATWNGMRLGWKTLAVPGGIGLALMLPFNQIQRLAAMLKSMLPGG